MLGDVVRIPIRAAAGTKVEARASVTPEASVQTVVHRVKGKAVAGTSSHEVEVKPGGKGTTKLYVTISPPNGKPTTDVYEFEVE